MIEKKQTRESESSPRYKILVDDFIQKIHDGVYRPGSKLPSIREIAEEYEVGRKVAHYAISRLAVMNYVYAETKRGVFVNPLLQAGRFYRLCLYIHITNPMSSGSTISNVYNAAFARGYDVWLHSNFNDGGKLDEYLRGGVRFDGVLFSGVVDDGLLKKIKPFNIPYMVLGNYNISADHPQERIDLENLIYESMVRHLRPVAGKKIGALLGGEPRNASDEQTRLGFTRAIRELSPGPSEKLIYSCRNDGFQECCELFQNHPDVIFVYGGTCIGYIKYCLLKKPETRPYVLVSTPKNIDPYDSLFFDKKIHMDFFGKEKIAHAVARLINTIEKGA